MAQTVTFTLDIGHTSDDRLDDIKKRCEENVDRVVTKESERERKVEWNELVDSPAVTFHYDCIRAVKASADEAVKNLPATAENGKMWKDMFSGAGRGTCCTNQQCPTNMIYVPTKEGISQNPLQYCSLEDWQVRLA
jgi:acetylornithine deacetylase/succinyl-diaminopimelate desuccinylase-like protein